MLTADQLAAPISDESPTGVDLSAESSAVGLHWQITDARDKAAEEPQPGDPVAPEERWKALVTLCEQALAEHSKNTMYTALLIEARMALDGYAGLAAALEATHEIIARYGVDCFPRDDYGDDEYPGETTMLPLIQLQTRSILSLARQLPITGAAGGKSFSLWDWTEASRIESASQEERDAYLAAGNPKLHEIQDAAAQTPTERLQQTVSDITDAIELLDELAEAINSAVHRHVAGYDKLKDSLITAHDAVKELAGGRLDVAEATEGGEVDGDGVIAVANGAAGVAVVAATQVGAIGNREDAFRVLGDVASFFEKTEPQSLLPSQIRRVVDWGRMPPSELYAQLIDDHSVLRDLSRLTGMELKQDDDD